MLVVRRLNVNQGALSKIITAIVIILVAVISWNLAVTVTNHRQIEGRKDEVDAWIYAQPELFKKPEDKYNIELRSSTRFPGSIIVARHDLGGASGFRVGQMGAFSDSR